VLNGWFTSSVRRVLRSGPSSDDRSESDNTSFILKDLYSNGRNQAVYVCVRLRGPAAELPSNCHHLR
jgi:hypothetical protein